MIKHTVGDAKPLTGKLLGFYRGVVEDNNDPLQAGRVRIRIFGLHTEEKIKRETEGIPTDELQWFQPCLPIMEGGVSEYGIFSVPLQGSHVMVFFEGGNIMQGRYFASMPAIVSQLPDTTKGFNDPNGQYPEKTGVDWNSGNGQYPHNFVIAVHGGHYIELDSTPGVERIKVRHKSGTQVEVNPNGSVDIDVVDTVTKTVTGNVIENYENSQTTNITWDRTTTIGRDDTITVSNDMNQNIGNDKTITVDGLTVEETGPYTLTINGNWNVTATGNIVITSGNTTVTGGVVNLAAQETMSKLLNESFAELYDNHTHQYWDRHESDNQGGNWRTSEIPNEQSDSGDMTSNTQAS